LTRADVTAALGEIDDLAVVEIGAEAVEHRTVNR
jgi:hypothetical protein